MDEEDSIERISIRNYWSSFVFFCFVCCFLCLDSRNLSITFNIFLKTALWVWFCFSFFLKSFCSRGSLSLVLRRVRFIIMRAVVILLQTYNLPVLMQLYSIFLDYVCKPSTFDLYNIVYRQWFDSRACYLLGSGIFHL